MVRVDHIRVGFFGAESRFWPIETKWGKGAAELADYLWRANVNGRLDLVLGIIHNGASYLLLPRAWVSAWNQRVGGPAFSVRSVDRADYASLSPIHFVDHHDLFKKLKQYEQDANKKKKLGPNADASKANQRYYMRRGPDEVDIGFLRADFEHSRLFYALLHPTDSQHLPVSFRQPSADLPRLAWEAYTVHHQTALSCARILALSFSTISAGTEEDARVLDIGWCDVFVRTVTTGGAINCMFEDQRMKIPGLRFRHDDVKSEILPPSVISSRLQEILDLARPESPVILLVHGVNNTRKQLDSLGFRTSRWPDGIRGVLYEGGLKNRERSRSPPRRGSVKHRSPPRPSPSVHIVDVEALVNCATNRPNSVASTNHARVRNILKNAAQFGVDIQGREIEVLLDPTDPEGPKLTKTLFNAGHDSLLIAETWFALVNGPDIDELSVVLGEDIIQGPIVDDVPSPEPDVQREHDDDDDPNAEPPASGSRGRPQASSGGMTDAFDAYDLSDED